MLDSDTKRRIDTARDILVGKVPDPKSQVEQITIAMIYKFMDDMDAEAEELGGKRSFFAGAYARYGWAKLMRSGLGGHEMLALYAEAITKMPENPGIPPLFRDIFKNAYLPYRDPETLRAFLKIIDEFTYDHSEKLGDAFEYLLSVLGSQGDAGQFRSPRHIIDFMVAIIDPKKSESVLDPACGTVGFLISAFKHILRANTDKNGRCTLTPDEKARLAANFKGYDISPDMVRLSLVNLYLHGFTEPHVYEYDTLTSQDRWNEYFDVILANPPFMSPKGGIKPHKRFSIQAKRSEVLFVDYIAEHLTPKGRAAIIVPEGIIFQSQGAYKDLRKMLVDHSLVAVISLPAGCFNPYSGVKTSILILDKTLARQSDSIGFFKVENDGFGLGAQRRAIEKNDLPQVQAEVTAFLQAIRDRQPTADLEPTSGLIVPKEKIAANGDYNLSGERYRDGAARASNYPTVPIGDICELFNGRAFKPEDWENVESGGIPIVRIQNLNNAESSFNYFTGEVSERNTINNGELLFSWSGSRGTSFGAHIWGGQKAVLNQHIFKVGFDATRATKMYLYHALNKAVTEVEENLHGGVGLVHITKGNLEKIEIPLPPLSVQQEIVAEIEGYQKVINGARAVLDHYRPHIPIHPEWPIRNLGSLAENLDSRRVPITKGDRKAGPFPYYGASGVVDSVAGFLFDEEILLISEDGANLIARSTPIAFSVTGKCWVNNHAHVLRFAKAATQKFVEVYLNSISIEEFVTGAAQPKLNQEALNRIPIPISDEIATQQAIVAEIEAEQALVAANRELIARFEKKIQSTLARVWGEEEPKALDCGSPLPLSDPQPAAESPRNAKEKPRASRLAPGKRQQAAAVHENR
jgi:type I restriction enzyme M protein